jgi:hypothetical protein
VDANGNSSRAHIHPPIVLLAFGGEDVGKGKGNGMDAADGGAHLHSFY